MSLNIDMQHLASLLTDLARSGPTSVLGKGVLSPSVSRPGLFRESSGPIWISRFS